MSIRINIIITSFCAGVPWLGAAVGGTVAAQGDVAAAAGVVLFNTDVATFVFKVRVTLLGAGVPLVSAGVSAFHPTIFIRTVAEDLTLCIGGTGGTVLWTLVITCL